MLHANRGSNVALSYCYISKGGLGCWDIMLVVGSGWSLMLLYNLVQILQSFKVWFVPPPSSYPPEFPILSGLSSSPLDSWGPLNPQLTWQIIHWANQLIHTETVQSWLALPTLHIIFLLVAVLFLLQCWRCRVDRHSNPIHWCCFFWEYENCKSWQHPR